MNPATLRQAAQIVRARWGQGALWSFGRVCALGAVAEATSGSPINSQDIVALRAMVRVLQLTVDAVDPVCGTKEGAAIAAWNDAKDQTAENVAAGLEFVALVWEQEEAEATRLATDNEQNGVQLA